jgi:hypothetical protein
MINNITNNILNRASSELSDSKDKILALSKKKAQETFDNNIPSPESFKNELNGISSNSPTTLRKAEQVYQKTTRTIEKAIQKLEGSKRELQVIKDKLVGIGENFTFLNNLIGPGTVIGSLIEVLKGLPVLIDGLLATQVTPVVSGTVIDKAGDFKKLAKDNVQKFSDISSTLPTFENFFTKETNLLIPPIDTGISNTQSIINQLNILLEQIRTIWTNFILGLDLPELQDTTTGDENSNVILGGTTLKEYLSNPDNLSTVITDLIIPSTRKVRVEIRENGPGTELYQSNIIETTIN